MHRHHHTRNGFTLIELLIVIAIIGILAAVLIPNLLGSRNQAFDTGAMNCGKALQAAQTAHYGKYFTYADTPAELLAVGDDLLEPCLAQSNLPNPGIRLAPEAPTDVTANGDATLSDTYTANALGFEAYVWDQRGSTVYSVTQTDVRAIDTTTGSGDGGGDAPAPPPGGDRPGPPSPYT